MGKMVSKNQGLILLSLAVSLFYLPETKFASQAVFTQKRQTASKHASNGALTFRTVQRRLIGGRYRQNLHAAYWAAAQGAKIVPHLERMIYERHNWEAEKGPELAFPLNAFWALAHIQTPRSLRVLEEFYELRPRVEWAGLAIKGFKLREKMKSNEYGVLIKEATLQTHANAEDAELIQVIEKGQEVRILREGIKYRFTYEVDRTSETLTYDYVEVLGTGQRGYIQRGADNFTPFI